MCMEDCASESFMRAHGVQLNASKTWIHLAGAAALGKITRHVNKLALALAFRADLRRFLGSQ